MSFSSYYAQERAHDTNAALYEYMVGSDLSVQNEHLRTTRETQAEEWKVTNHDPFEVFLGAWTADLNKEVSRRPSIPTINTLPDLPVEIWNAIIDLTTQIPGAYSLCDYLAIAAFMFDSRGICARSRFEATMRDKLALACVSKRLNTICQPFLYKHLRITSGPHAHVLLDMLRQRNIGEKTVRIDLALEGNHAWTKQHTHAIMSIFQHCPNLVCFSTLFCDPESWTYSLPDLIGSLTNHRHFKRIEVKAPKDVLRTMQTFLKGLEVLWLIPCQSPTIPEIKDHYLLPQLRALVVSDYRSVENLELEAPNLRACIIQKGSVSIIPSINSGRIEYLAVLNVQHTIPNLHVWTNLRTLSIKYTELATRKIDWPRGLQHPTLECILIEDFSYDFLRAASIERLRENLNCIMASDIFPHVRRIMIHLSFMKDRLPESEANVRWEWLRSCLKLGLQVEMLQGNMERTGNQWRTLSRDRLNGTLFPPNVPSYEEIISALYDYH